MRAIAPLSAAFGIGPLYPAFLSSGGVGGNSVQAVQHSVIEGVVVFCRILQRNSLCAGAAVQADLQIME